MFLLAFLLALPAKAAQELPGPYSAEIIDVVDGDTVRARIHVWLGQDLETLVRIKGIDTPELKGQCAQERELAQKARITVESLVNGKTVILKDIENGKYGGRVLAHMATENGDDVGFFLITRKLAHIYDGKKRPGWC